MRTQGFDKVFGPGKVAIGVIHLAPLPGSPGYGGDMEGVIGRAAREGAAMEKAGFGGLIVENYGDVPFHSGEVGPETVAAMALAVEGVRAAVGLPVGVNVLRNDARAALAVAGVCGAAFVRVNVLVGAMVTSDGIVEGRPAEVVRLRDVLAPGCLLLADVMVKHARPLGAATVEEEALDAAERGLADCVIVTGGRTGRPPEVAEVMEAREALAGAVRRVPVLVGSGATPENLEELLGVSDGVIVGTYMRKGGVAGAELDPERLAEMGGLVRKYGGRTGE